VPGASSAPTARADRDRRTHKRRSHKPAPAAPVEQEEDGPRITPFWRRLNDFFLFPFQIEPLIYAVLLSLCSYIIFLWIGLGLLIALGITRYAFKVTALASLGVLDSREYTRSMEYEEWKRLPWMLFGVLIVHGFVVGALGSISPWLGLLTMVLSSLLLPATVMVLIQTLRFTAALNPLELWQLIADIGKQYLLLWLFSFLLQGGTSIVGNLLLPIVPRALLIPAGIFITVYFTWVMAALTGYVMYQHHDALGIDPIQTPETGAPSASRERPEAIRARVRDAAVSDLVQRGDLNTALSEAREWVRTSDDPLTDRRRYQRLLLLDDPVTGRLADHTPRYLALLLAERRASEALAAWQAVQGKLPGYALGEPAVVIGLAEYACKNMDAKTALELLRGFDKRFANAPEVPKGYELIVRVLKQCMGRGDKALLVYHTLRKRFPDHPCTEEARWLLREELSEPSSAPASAPAPSA
jgi:hypothetical protein